MATQLQVLSSYTLLHSTIRLQNLVQQAKQLGYDSIALTDINVTYGLVEFYKIAQQNHICPILGLTLEIPGLILTEQNYHLIVLAKNNTGYHNLLKLSTAVMSQKYPFKLQENSNLLQNLIMIVPAVNSELNALLEQKSGEITTLLTQLKNLFGSKFYLGISLRDGAQSQISLIQRLAQLQDLEVVALDNIQYLEPDDAFSTEVLQHIARGDQVTTVQPTGDNYLRSHEKFIQEYHKQHLQTAVANTQKIAQQCQVEIEFQRTLLPHFITPNKLDAMTYLQQLVAAGLRQKFGHSIPQKYLQRAQHELAVIKKMGYADYFLIVWDAVQQAHKMQIMTGPGRGSAAGSLVSYILDITQIDPVEYGLLFERFLNPERVDMPDIDLDLPDDRRDDLVKYMQQKYGNEHMAQIITFGTFAAKQALRDVGRVFGLSSMELSHWSHAIPKILGINLKTAYQQSSTLRNLYQQSSKNKLIFKTALKIEGLPRHFSTHAAGIVLSAHNLNETVALQSGGSDGALLTQQTKNNVEALGLLKIDFLGLRNLTILNTAVQLVQQNFNSQFQLSQIPLDDKSTLELFQKGDTEGVFQFESSGIREVLRRLQPTNFQDIVATNALYRPGPMQNIPHFIARKHNQEAISYPDDSLKPILESTYGILVYQEQVMQVVSQMAGFSLAEADLLRRAIAKKDEHLLTKKRAQFITQSVQRGHKQENAIQVYEYIERFANYGFNKSHAVAYSQLAYALAYLKVHYPQAFFIALLNSNLNNNQKLITYLQALKLRKIEVLPPNINYSQKYFSLENKKVRFGLLCIKKVRRDLVNNIVAQRQPNKFISLVDFLQRIDPRFLKAEDILPLVYSGALDDFSRNRRQLVQNVVDLIESLKLAGGSVSLFDVLKPKTQQINDFSLHEKLVQEKQYLGAYVSSHPVERYQHSFKKRHICSASTLTANMKAYVLYYVKDIKVIRTKKGTNMAFLKGGDEVWDYSVTVFPQLYQKIIPQIDRVYLIQLKVTTGRKHDLEYIAQSIELANDALKQEEQVCLYVRFATKSKQNLQRLLQLTQRFPGTIPVVVYFAAVDEKFLLKNRNYIADNVDVRKELQKLVGSGNFIYQ